MRHDPVLWHDSKLAAAITMPSTFGLLICSTNLMCLGAFLLGQKNSLASDFMTSAIRGFAGSAWQTDIWLAAITSIMAAESEYRKRSFIQVSGAATRQFPMSLVGGLCCIFMQINKFLDTQKVIKF